MEDMVAVVDSAEGQGAMEEVVEAGEVPEVDALVEVVGATTMAVVQVNLQLLSTVCPAQPRFSFCSVS